MFVLIELTFLLILVRTFGLGPTTDRIGFPGQPLFRESAIIVGGWGLARRVAWCVMVWPIGVEDW